MGNPVFVQLPMDDSRHVIWTGTAHNGVCRRDPLDIVARTIVGEQVVAVVPGLNVWLGNVISPPMNQSTLEKAVPFLLEEQLSCPVEELHFSLGKQRKDGTLPVVVLARTLLTRWLDELRKVGIQPQVLVCEPLLLPWKPRSWTLLLAPARVVVRTGWDSGFALDPDHLEPLLALALRSNGQEKPEQLYVLDNCIGYVHRDFSELGIPVQVKKITGDPLSVFAENFKVGPVLNLLQGEYAPRDWWCGGWQYFRLTAFLLVGWLLFRGGYSLREVDHLLKETQDLDSRIEIQFRKAFPDIHRVVDPQAQMSHQLQIIRRGHRSESEDGFLLLMAHAGAVLQTVSGVTLKRVRFQDKKLDLFLSVSDLQQLDQIRQAMAKGTSFSAEIQNANKGKEGVEGNLRIFKP